MIPCGATWREVAHRRNLGGAGTAHTAATAEDSHEEDNRQTATAEDGHEEDDRHEDTIGDFQDDAVQGHEEDDRHEEAIGDLQEDAVQVHRQGLNSGVRAGLRPHTGQGRPGTPGISSMSPVKHRPSYSKYFVHEHAAIPWDVKKL